MRRDSSILPRSSRFRKMFKAGGQVPAHTVAPASARALAMAKPYPPSSAIPATKARLPRRSMLSIHPSPNAERGSGNAEQSALFRVPPSDFRVTSKPRRHRLILRRCTHPNPLGEMLKKRPHLGLAQLVGMLAAVEHDEPLYPPDIRLLSARAVMPRPHRRP